MPQHLKEVIVKEDYKSFGHLKPCLQGVPDFKVNPKLDQKDVE